MKKSNRAKFTILDPFTFGDSKAAVVLVELLNKHNSRRVISEVGKLCAKTNSYYKDVLYCEFKFKFLEMIRENTVKAINNTTWPDNIKSYTKNYIRTRFKQFVNDDWE